MFFISGNKKFLSISNKLTYKQNQIGPIQLFSIYFVLICTINKNFVPRCAVLEKNVALLA